MHLDKHPVLWKAYEVAQAIERCRASTQLTDAVIKVSALGEEIEKLVDAHVAESARLKGLLERACAIGGLGHWYIAGTDYCEDNCLRCLINDALGKKVS